MCLVPPDPGLPGRWRRTLLQTAQGVRDTTTSVTWLQGDSLYVDLRLPAGPATSASCLRDLDRRQVLALATAQGFAGRLEADGPWACWRRDVDVHPAGSPDEGRLDPAGDGVLVETGRDGSYVEHWRRGGTPTPRAAVLLRDPGTGATAVLLRVGDDLAWARGRAVPVPPGGTLAELVTGAATDRAAQDLVDTEVSLALGAGTITSSSLPWRTGAPLGITLTGSTAQTDDVDPDGSPCLRRWDVVAGEGDLALLPGRPDRRPRIHNEAPATRRSA